MNPLLILGAVGGGLLLLSTKKASASTATGVPVTSTPTPGTVTTTTAPSGTVTRTYTVEKGDYPARIAEKLTGDATRWLELIRANPQKPVWTSADKARLEGTPAESQVQVGNFQTLYAGEHLNLPAGW